MTKLGAIRGVERDDHRHHRYRRFLYFSWAGDDFSALSLTLNAGGEECHDDNPAQHANRQIAG
jgi:hypothetical protein